MNLIIHVTGQTDLPGTSSSTSPNSSSEKVSAKDHVILTESSPAILTSDPEKGAEQQPTGNVSSSVKGILPGRPNIDNLIAAAAAGSARLDDRIIVGACGPSRLMSTTRKAVDNELLNDGPSITLYTEVS